MKKKLTQTLLAIVMITMMASCTKEEIPTVYKPIDYISVPRAEYKIRNDMAYLVRFSISNQSNKTLYYCKFRVSQCYESGTAFYSKTYEVGSKEDMSQWTLAPGDIDFTDYYDCYFVFVDDGSITSEIIDAKFY
jgi:hypothetical protein